MKNGVKEDDQKRDFRLLDDWTTSHFTRMDKQTCQMTYLISVNFRFDNWEFIAQFVGYWGRRKTIANLWNAHDSIPSNSWCFIWINSTAHLLWQLNLLKLKIRGITCVTPTFPHTNIFNFRRKFHFLVFWIYLFWKNWFFF